jgi:hypothetical protein
MSLMRSPRNGLVRMDPSNGLPAYLSAGKPRWKTPRTFYSPVIECLRQSCPCFTRLSADLVLGRGNAQ